MDIEKKTSYINLSIGTENFAVSVYNVLEIIKYGQVTRIPDASDYVPGVLNFRGSIVPVIDMHKRFRTTGGTSDARMVVVVSVRNKDKDVLMGLLVDQVTDVVEFDFRSVKSVPDLGINYNPEYVDGFIELDGRFIMVLNIDRVLKVDELSEVSEISYA